MFEIAIGIGLYSYLILFLGIFGLLFKETIFISTAIFVLFYLKFIPRLKLLNFSKNKRSALSVLILTLTVIQLFVNFIGVLGPEVSFDALWYHLTLPKLYLNYHQILHFSGGLLYYSDTPKLTEMLYTAALSFGTENVAKFIHFSFSMLIVFVIFKLSRKFLNFEYSLLASLIFLSNLVVGWESITSYIDLARTFFETLAFVAIIRYFQNWQYKWLLASSFMLGFAITSKLISVFSIPIYIGIIIFMDIDFKTRWLEVLKKTFLFTFISLLTASPWLIFSFINTGNPVYPYFSIPVDSGSFLSLPNLSDLKSFFLYLNDPISPIYLIFLPLTLIYLKSFNKLQKTLILYSFFGFLIWFFAQEQRGSRFLLPYLPIFSILTVLTISKIKNTQIRKFSILLVFVISLLSISYRALANYKYVPVILGVESKKQFLTNNLNFSFGDFYDTDEYFKAHIKKTDKVLLYGFHNLYYVDFPFIDSSYVKKGDRFNYIAVQNSNIPDKFSSWTKIYYNPITKVSLYTLKRQIWEY